MVHSSISSIGHTRSSVVPTRETSIRTKLDGCLTQAVEHCIESQKANGSWEVIPDPRIFENALVGYALSRSPRGECDAPVTRAKQWIANATPQSHSPIASLIEESLKSIFLSKKKTIDLTASILAGAEFKSRLLLLFALALDSKTPVRASFSETTLREMVTRRLLLAENTQIKQWTKVEIASAYLILHNSTDKVGLHSENMYQSALNTLTDSQNSSGGFYNNPVASALAYIALCKATPHLEARHKCKKYLLNNQQDDGTWRFCTSDVWDTVLTIRSFRGHPLFDSQALEPAAEFLKEVQNDDKGWSFSSDVESDNDTTAAAILALKDAPSAKSHCMDALNFLSKYQQADGLWRTWRFTEDPPVEDVNAHVLSAINATRGWHQIQDDAVRRWLLERYRTNGGWSASWYRGKPYAVCEVSEGLGSDNPVVQKAIDHLAYSQNADGGWGPEAGCASIPSATGLAINALLRCRPTTKSTQIRKGLAFLIDTQQADGLWKGIPEMFGPRPLLSHYQTHTQAFTVSGMIAAWQQYRRGVQ